MSMTQEQIDKAVDTLHEEVYAPVFFDKLASLKIAAPATAAEAYELMQLGAVLREQFEANQTKTASSRVDQLRAMREKLSGAKQPAQTFGKAAAANPAVAAAVLSLSLAETKA